MPKQVNLPSPDEVEVRIPDPETGAKRVYRLAVMTRYRKRSITEAKAAFEKTIDALPEDAEPSVEQEEQVMRGACDMLNLLLVSRQDDTIPAGDLLYQSWLDEEVTDDQILGLMRQLAEQGAQDPT